MNRPLAIAALGLVMVAAAVALNLTLRSPDVRESSSPNAADTTVRASAAPSFDVVRIDALGNMVMAGRAMPGAVVTILDGTTELGRVTTDARGEWVFTPDQTLPPGTRELSLSAVGPDGRKLISETVVVMSVPGRGGEVMIVEQSRQGGRSRVLQGANAPAEMKALTVDSLDYDEQGRMSVGGKSEPGSRVRVYLDNTPIGEAVTDSRGQWTLTPDMKAVAGPHTVRADEIGANDTVLARVEVPFSVTLDATAAAGGSVTVVRGNSLWRIARRVYGQGTMYSVIFDANRDQIRDPNLIYPGQIFQMPGPAKPSG